MCSFEARGEGRKSGAARTKEAARFQRQSYEAQKVLAKVSPRATETGLPRHAISTHLRERPDAMIASQTFVVSSASRKVGEAGLPLFSPSRKSAT
jgi:hypothetical protein